MTKTEAERLARLEAILDGIVARMDEDRKYQREQHRIAQESREAIKLRLNQLNSKTKDLDEWRSNKVDPMIDMAKTYKGKIAGGLLVLGFFGAILIFVIRTFTDEIRGMFGAG